MRMLAGFGVALVLAAVGYADRTRQVGLGEVARCLKGAGAREAFAEYVSRFPRLTTYAEKMLAIDRLVHAVHKTGGVAARNLFEGRAREVLATLDSMAAARHEGRRESTATYSAEGLSAGSG